MGPVRVKVMPEGVTSCNVSGSYIQVVLLDDLGNLKKQIHLRVEGIKNLRVSPQQNNIRPSLQPSGNSVDLPAIFDIRVTGMPSDTGVLEVEIYFGRPGMNAKQYIANHSPFDTIEVKVQIC